MAKKSSASRPRGVAKRQIFVLTLALGLIAGAMTSFFLTEQQSSRNQRWLDQRLDLREDIERFTKISREASQGLEPDFRALTDLQKDFGSLIRTFAEGDPETGMQPLPGEDYQLDVLDLQDIWAENQDSITAILENAETYQRTTSNIAFILQSVESIKGFHQDLNKGPATTSQLLVLERMAALARSLTGLAADPVAIAQELQDLEAQYRDNAARLTGAGGAFELAVASSEFEFNTISDAISQIAADAEALFTYQDAAGGFLGAATNIVTAGNTVEQDVLDVVLQRQVDPQLSYALGGGGILLLLVFIFMFLLDARRRTNEALERDAMQQKAILDLLDEITNLADGDLTVDVTVTEDFTGAIADSINYTVGSMRSLVGTINDTSAEIANAASSTADTARQMNQASERQAKEVTSVTNAIVASSEQLQDVATRAETLAQDAQKSVDVAHSGAETVGRTIQNMTTLREQIQDTAKRIKRLGESSQEIGNIIEFINDIAEQTNTLALNASIQAAMAGEQGRGFAVVADEVQRLAERAANATRQIENLVRTIQADTNEAIVSMERSTANVVAGAKSAEEAGQALTQIESSSNDLARLIQEISTSARSQSANASQIAGTMQVIRDIAVQTSGSAAQTAEAVGNLNSLSEKLRESVSGFKLPEEAPA